MAKIIFSKTAAIAMTALVAVLGVALFLWQIFGGKAHRLKEGEFINIKKSELKEKTDKEIQKERKEQIAVAYNESPTLGIREVILKTGNLDFIREGDRVLIKPNVNSDAPTPGTTNPEVIAEIVRLAKARGAYVIVADHSNPRWDTMEAMEKLGIVKAVKSAGADEVLGLEDYGWTRIEPEKASHWPRGFRVSKIVFDVDHIINVPNLHTHFITGHSLALKNLVGLVHPTDRYFFHASSNINQMIAEISLAIRPAINLIEGSKSFLKEGPFEGEVGEPKVYLASFDPVAADILGLELLLKHGAKPKYPDIYENPQTKRALELGLNILKKEEIEEKIKTL